MSIIQATIQNRVTTPPLDFSSYTDFVYQVGEAWHNSAPVVTGGTPPYTFTKTAGTLPSGLLYSGTLGLVSGVPTNASGPYNYDSGTNFPITVECQDSASQTDSVTVNFKIYPALAIFSDVFSSSFSSTSGTRGLSFNHAGFSLGTVHRINNGSRSSLGDWVGPDVNQYGFSTDFSASRYEIRAVLTAGGPLNVGYVNGYESLLGNTWYGLNNARAWTSQNAFQLYVEIRNTQTSEIAEKLFTFS